jgi:hypothetical protein
VHLLAAYDPGSRILSVESVNATAADDVQGLEVEALSAGCFKEIFRELMMSDNVIVKKDSKGLLPGRHLF